MMDQSNIGSGATVAELMQVASTALKMTEKNWATYESLPRDPRQSEAAFQRSTAPMTFTTARWRS